MMQQYAPGCEKLQGVYRGKVVKHLSNGKCKIWIPTIHPAEWNSFEKADLLPDAQQASSLAFGAVDGLGVFSYPNIGSVVWCLFENGDQNLPVYFASQLGGKEACEQWDQSRCVPGSHPNDAYMHHIEVRNSHIYVSEYGNIKITTHDSSKSSKSTIVLDPNGNITLESTSTIALKAKNISIDGSTQVDIKAPNVKIDANIHLAEVSPSIELDSSNGHTTIKSRAEYSAQNPEIKTF